MARKRKTEFKLPLGVPSIREYRKGIAKLKRAGIIAKTYDARSVKPSSFLTAALRKFAPVVKGQQSVYKVKGKTKRAKAAEVKRLKAEGFTVVNGKVLTSKQEIYRGGGKVTTRGTASVSSNIHFADVEDAIRKVFASKPGIKMGFRVFGFPSVQTFSDADAAVDWILSQYDPEIDTNGKGAFSLVVLTDKEIGGYVARAEAAHDKAMERRKALKNTKAKRRRKARKSRAKAK